ncbi:MAG: hypothetical protein N2380_08935 [bacterium]|nr:hypothetical protein [bacterium]
MPDSVNSVDTLQMSIVFYAIKKAQSIGEEVSNTLIQKTLQKMKDDNKLLKELEKDIFPWLGRSIDEKI